MKLCIWSEIQQSADLYFSCAQIIQKLLLPCGLNCASSFQFNDDFIVDKNIGSKIPDLLPAKPNGDSDLPLEEDLMLREGDPQCLLIHRLQKPMP